MKFERRHLLLNYVFIICLIILVLNDHVFKWEFSNWFTGKLSDIVGMIILPVLITFFNPKHVKFNLFLSAVLFMFWKSSWSTSAIDIYNQYAFIKTSRVVDYTDYIALLMLPLAHVLIKNIQTKSAFVIPLKLNASFILLPTLFILMSETPPRYFYLTANSSSFICHNCDVTLRMTQKQILEKLRAFDIKKDTTLTSMTGYYRTKGDSLNYYKIEKFIIENDTLHNVQLSMIKANKGKTRVYFNGFDYRDTISNAKMERKLRRYFRKSVKRYLKDLTQN
ncbi:hypothetical protein [Psychroserpens luteolus]|uniref:hypothetical protein n=1 Tax=Psychroserpens luteolus TaxID=2855840 RepID=UPI001E32D859|nr:hypothetical protein [Psychroserpens luteolus]MCD2258758.1 hypothetical protein [Psychroserpens luteolus]